jgi:hypothetical protein
MGEEEGRGREGGRKERGDGEGIMNTQHYHVHSLPASTTEIDLFKLDRPFEA